MTLMEEVHKIEAINSIRYSGYNEKKIILDNLVSDCYSNFRVKAEFRIDEELIVDENGFDLREFKEYPLRTQFKPMPAPNDHTTDCFSSYVIYKYEFSNFFEIFSFTVKNKIAIINRQGVLSDILENDEWHELSVWFWDKSAYEPSIEFARKYKELTSKKTKVNFAKY